MADGKTPSKREEEQRERLREDLEDVGENLPEDMRGVEGSDVGRVVRDDREAELNPLGRESSGAADDVDVDLAPKKKR